MIADPAEAKDDGKLYLSLAPVQDATVGFVGSQRAALEGLAKRGIGAALFVGDNVFFKVGDFKDSLEAIVINDHHQWGSDLVKNLRGKESDDFIVINNHQLLPPDKPDAYASGAFAADLMRNAQDSDYDTIAKLSLISDKYAEFFPGRLAAVDHQEYAEVAGLLNYAGTFLYNWPGGDKKAKRQIMTEFVLAIAQTTDIEALNDRLSALTEKYFGTDFTNKREQVVQATNDSIEAFLTSKDPIYFYRIESESEISLVVHKMAFSHLNQSKGFGKRVLVHYQVSKDGNVSVLLGRDSKFNALDVSQVPLNPPHGIKKWGGGHRDRAGFSTDLKDPQDQARLAQWWGAERDPDRVLRYLRTELAKQLAEISKQQ